MRSRHVKYRKNASHVPLYAVVFPLSGMNFAGAHLPPPLGHMSAVGGLYVSAVILLAGRQSDAVRISRQETNIFMVSSHFLDSIRRER